MEDQEEMSFVDLRQENFPMLVEYLDAQTSKINAADWIDGVGVYPVRSWEEFGHPQAIRITFGTGTRITTGLADGDEVFEKVDPPTKPE